MTVSHLRFGPGPIRLDLPDRRGRLRGLPPVRLPGPHGRARPGPARGHLPAQQPLPARRGLGPPARRRPARDRRQGPAPLRHRRRPGGPRGRHGPAHQHGHAALLLRPLRCPAPDQALAAIKGSIEMAFAKPRPGGRRAQPGRRRRAPWPPCTRCPFRSPARPAAPSTGRCRARRPTSSPRVTARMLAGNGDLLPVSALPVDGTFPTGTARWEKRSLAAEIPIWDQSICIDCGKCAHRLPARDHPHEGLRPRGADGRPGRLPVQGLPLPRPARARLTIQVAPDDCTGCGVCVEVCPAQSKEEVRHKAINMAPVGDRSASGSGWDFILPRSAGAGPRRPRPGHGQGLPGPPAAVRVLRGLCAAAARPSTSS